MSSNGNCAACGRAIDTSAKLCPYCGADPISGEKGVDTQAILQEVFHPREISTSESVLEFARQRQGIVIAGSLLVAFLVLAGFHQYVTMRNANAVTDAPAVPLSEITDLANQQKPAAAAPMPELDFPFEGRPQTMRTFIMERGALAPAPPPPPGGAAAASAAVG
ncbi:MAG TPA: zinc ribbon domain-containing protein, partial [Thermoanaerobaculia bacterium]|nr:zinc ribbon domain-containing protein [Thermoanaerobaculia bacterium]